MNITPVGTHDSAEASGITTERRRRSASSPLAPARTGRPPRPRSCRVRCRFGNRPGAADSLGRGPGDVADTACDIDDVFARLKIGHAQQIFRHRCGDERHEVALVVLGGGSSELSA